jgi:tellurium resistance protein TerD
MSLSLSKGGSLSLSKEVPGLSKITVGLGWDPRTTAGEDFDLDASALLINANGKVRSSDDFIFYNQKSSTNGSVVHNGDNLTGTGTGDDETISVDLDNVEADVERIVFAVSINLADQRNQNFGQVRNAFIRIINEADGVEISRYDLAEDSGGETSMVFAEVYKNGGGWKFKAVGQGYTTGLRGIAEDFGVEGLTD